MKKGLQDKNISEKLLFLIKTQEKIWEIRAKKLFFLVKTPILSLLCNQPTQRVRH